MKYGSRPSRSVDRVSRVDGWRRAASQPGLRLLWPLSAALAVGLSACGGGGGGGSSDAPNQAPTAVGRVVGEAVLQAETKLDASGSSDADGSIASHSWAYGDGQTGTSDTHVYATAGSYTATLTVTDNAGATATSQVNVTVGKCSADGLARVNASSQKTGVCMQTNRGELVLELFPTQAPVTVSNFLAYVDSGFYNGTLFHRAEPGFVIQGGGYSTGMVLKAPTRDPIVLESANGLANARYTVAMARTNVANSATSQFFVNLQANTFLNYNPTLGTANGYAVFGQVLQTATADAVLASIANSRTNPSGGLSIIDPSNEVVIRSAVRLP